MISDAYLEPDRHYQLLPGGRSKLVDERRLSKWYRAAARERKGGIEAVIGQQTTLVEDNLLENERLNDFVNELRDSLRRWRGGTGEWGGNTYGDTALVTRRLLEWWFERDEERKATGRRFFFCQREAVEAVIYLYEVKNKIRMPETNDLVRYALKLATGTGKTLVMALFIVWSTLHVRKVAGSSLSSNFLVLVPNLTVRDRVSGHPRGDGLDPTGGENLYDAFDLVPPEYRDEFHPNVLVKNWQAISLESDREDWIPESLREEGRFVPASVLWALRRRERLDPASAVKRLLGNRRDVVVVNDEAHHVYGEKRTRAREQPDYIKWNQILEGIAKVVRIPLVLDLSATPWYGSGSPKAEGTLFEWLVTDFNVYDAFESGLVKVVRLPEETGGGRIFLDLWSAVKGAKTPEDYLASCRSAIAALYSSWKEDFNAWRSRFHVGSDPSPVMLVVASDATRAEWVFRHLSRDYELLKNPDSNNRQQWVTIQIDSKVFDAEEGVEATLREMVNTVGTRGMPGEHVRCIVSVNMLSEGWDVKSVTQILGLRAFSSPLLTEQVIGRGLRLPNYDVLNQPLEERPEGSEETVDAFGIPFIGFPIQKRTRPRTGEWGQKPIWIEQVADKEKFRIRVPNVRSWAIGITRPLAELVRISDLPELVINPKETPAKIAVRPVVGGNPQEVLNVNEFRGEWPLLRTEFFLSRDLFERLSPGELIDQGFGPTFDELLEVTRRYVDTRVRAVDDSDVRDLAMVYWQQRALNVLETAIRSVGVAGAQTIPVLGTPEWLDTSELRRFQWTGVVGDGRKCQTNKIPCHNDLEKSFANFLDSAEDVLRYVKNERFGFSVTYYQGNRPRQYFPDFVVVIRDPSGREAYWLVETKGEIRPDTPLKTEAARLWCEKMSSTPYDSWKYLFAPQHDFEKAVAYGARSFRSLVFALGAHKDES